MQPDFRQRFQKQLDERKAQGLYRVIRPLERTQGERFVALRDHVGATNQTQDSTGLAPELLSFSSNDYLGLGGNEALWQNFLQELQELPPGFGAGASPLIRGYSTNAHTLAKNLAQFLGFEQVLLFPSGYQANLGLMRALQTLPDKVFFYVDRLLHASLLDGLNGADFKRFHHLDYSRLADLLEKRKHKDELPVVVTEGLFSMDGDAANIAQLAKLKEQYNFLLVVDDAHGAGVLGKTGQGVAEGFLGHIDFFTGNFSKSFGGQGGYVATAQVGAEFLINFCRSYIYSTGLAPAVAAYAQVALDRIVDGNDLRQDLRENIQFLFEQIAAAGLSDCIPGFEERHSAMPEKLSPIVPYMPCAGRPQIKGSIMDWMGAAQKAGLYLVGIRPPTVPKGTERFRISLTSLHTQDDIRRLVEFLGTLK